MPSASFAQDPFVLLIWDEQSAGGLRPACPAGDAAGPMGAAADEPAVALAFGHPRWTRSNHETAAEVDIRPSIFEIARGVPHTWTTVDG